jgi:hypothetical protein
MAVGFRLLMAASPEISLANSEVLLLRSMLGRTYVRQQSMFGAAEAAAAGAM